MKYPQALIDQVQKRSATFKLEGLNEGAGPKNPILMVIGEAPGRDEIKSHIPFHGRSGQELMKSLSLLGLKRQDVYITSVVRSRPYATKKIFSKKDNQIVIKHPNRKPTQKEILAHAPFLDYEISWAKPKVIVTVGNTALNRLIGPKFKISQAHGQILKDQNILQLNSAKDHYRWSKQTYTIFPTYHPAAIFYNRQLADIVKQDWLNLKSYLKL